MNGVVERRIQRLKEAGHIRAQVSLLDRQKDGLEAQLSGPVAAPDEPT